MPTLCRIAEGQGVGPMKVDWDATQPRGLTSTARSQGLLHGSREISTWPYRSWCPVSHPKKVKIHKLGQ